MSECLAGGNEVQMNRKREGGFTPPCTGEEEAVQRSGSGWLQEPSLTVAAEKLQPRELSG